MTELSPASSLIQRACDAAWAPLQSMTPDEQRADPAVVKGVRMSALAVLQGEHLRDIAPAMAHREEALSLACLLLDLGLAVHEGRKFLPGEVRQTAGVASMSEATAHALIDRHTTGDWGDCDADDAQANEVALEGGGRILSVYKNVRDGDNFWVKVWIITDADPEESDGTTNRLRLSTTILLPSEY